MKKHLFLGMLLELRLMSGAWIRSERIQAPKHDRMEEATR